MGFKNLELVKPGEFLTEEAKSMACNAGDLLRKARVYQRISDTTREKNLVIGATRRRGRQTGLIIPLEDGVRRIMIAAKQNKIGMLFWRERNGLTNREVEKCGFLMTIPSDPSSPSLNLAQSVMSCKTAECLFHLSVSYSNFEWYAFTLFANSLPKS